MMHIPIDGVKERNEIFQILQEFPHSFSISAHEHDQTHRFLSSKSGWNGEKPHHHLVNVTACGGWWTGFPDEKGIPHATMSDGAPNGYSIFTFDGNKYEIEFKAARYPASYQMSIYAPEEVKSEESKDWDVLVNVFSGSEKSKVMISFDGKESWVEMEKTSQEDPYYLMMKDNESKHESLGRKLPKPGKSAHLWKARLPKNMNKGKHIIYVRTIDMFGHEYNAYRIISIT